MRVIANSRRVCLFHVQKAEILGKTLRKWYINYKVTVEFTGITHYSHINKYLTSLPLSRKTNLMLVGLCFLDHQMT